MNISIKKTLLLLIFFIFSGNAFSYFDNLEFDAYSTGMGGLRFITDGFGNVLFSGLNNEDLNDNLNLGLSYFPSNTGFINSSLETYLFGVYGFLNFESNVNFKVNHYLKGILLTAGVHSTSTKYLDKVIYYENLYFSSFGFKFNNNIDLGLSLKFYNVGAKEQSGFPKNNFDIGLGFKWQKKNFISGFEYLNIFSNNSKNFQKPSYITSEIGFINEIFRFGFNYQLIMLNEIKEIYPSFSMGFEYKLKIISFRMGYRQIKTNNEFHSGIGFKFKNFNFDYANIKYLSINLPVKHSLTFSTRFWIKN